MKYTAADSTDFIFAFTSKYFFFSDKLTVDFVTLKRVHGAK
jgi:hypothetical protein